MKKPISDSAEVSLDFPDKFFVGSFGRHSSYDVVADEHGVHVKLEHNEGAKRCVEFHLHYLFLADLLTSIGQAMSANGPKDGTQRQALAEAVGALDKTFTTNSQD